MSKKISPEEKAEAAILFLTGKASAISLGKLLGVNRIQIYCWAKVYEKTGMEGFGGILKRDRYYSGAKMKTKNTEKR